MMWIARDRNGKLYLYSAKPKISKALGMYTATGKNPRVMQLSEKRFPSQRWGYFPTKVKIST